MISRNYIWYLIAGGVLLVAFLVRSPYMAFSLYAFLALVAIANMSSLAWLAGLDAERVLSQDTISIAESVDVHVTVTNRRGWPIPWIFLEDIVPDHATKTGENSRLAILMPGQQVEMLYRLTFSKRGYHRIGPLMMESGDLFGLQRRFRTGRQQDYVSVLPSIAYIDTFSVASRRPQGPVRMTNKIYEDPSRLAGTREYVPGDPMNRVHWKASARTGELFTKHYETSSVQGGTVVLDLHAESYKPERTAYRMELAITTAASIAYLLQQSGEQVGLLTNALDAAEVARYEVEAGRALSRDEVEDQIAGEGLTDRISPLHVPTLRTPMQSRKISENLARVVPGHGLDLETLLLSEFRGLPRDASLLPIVPYVSESLALTLGSLKLSGFAITVFFISDERGYEEAAALLAQHSIHTFHIVDESSLLEIAPQRIGH